MRDSKDFIFNILFRNIVFKALDYLKLLRWKSYSILYKLMNTTEYCGLNYNFLYNWLGPFEEKQIVLMC